MRTTIDWAPEAVGRRTQADTQGGDQSMEVEAAGDGANENLVYVDPAYVESLKDEVVKAYDALDKYKAYAGELKEAFVRARDKYHKTVEEKKVIADRVRRDVAAEFGRMMAEQRAEYE
ncbi:unnamed protein product [Sphagnum balticum]